MGGLVSWMKCARPQKVYNILRAGHRSDKKNTKCKTHKPVNNRNVLLAERPSRVSFDLGSWRTTCNGAQGTVQPNSQSACSDAASDSDSSSGINCLNVAARNNSSASVAYYPCYYCTLDKKTLLHSSCEHALRQLPMAECRVLRSPRVVPSHCFPTTETTHFVWATQVRCSPVNVLFPPFGSLEQASHGCNSDKDISLDSFDARLRKLRSVKKRCRSVAVVPSSFRDHGNDGRAVFLVFSAETHAFGRPSKCQFSCIRGVVCQEPNKCWTSEHSVDHFLDTSHGYRASFLAPKFCQTQLFLCAPPRARSPMCSSRRFSDAGNTMPVLR